IRGVLHVKDVLLYPNKPYRELMRQPLFVPEKKRLSALLNQFRRTHQHMAVVVDEYGGTSGCVTLNDLLEEIFGDLVEIGDTETTALHKINDHTYEVDGLHRIDSLNDELDLDLPDDDAATVSGLISSTLGDFPKVHTRLNINGV